MATGHILPGYGQPVSTLRRARSAGCYPLDSVTLLGLKNAAQMSKRDLDTIRENAKNLWLRDVTQPTTYDSHFAGPEVVQKRTPRPTSSHRANNPHPPPVFLTNRLHYIDGYHNADTTLGKSPYKNLISVDASLGKLERDRRREPRIKHVGLPDPAQINLYKDPFGFRSQLPARQAQAAEAWVKLADDADREKVLDVVNQNTALFEDNPRPKTAYVSLHRWMKPSGVEEHEATRRIMKTIQSDPLTLGHKGQEDIHAAGKFRFTQRLNRGDYSIHPGWPTSLPHHRVP